jgi:large subunit ribosomal protein L1
MGKKKVSVLGSENEESLRAKKATKLTQKKLREGKTVVKENLPDLPDTPNIPDAPSPTVSSSKRKSHIRTQTYKSAKAQIKSSSYSLANGLELLRTISKPKFDPTVELHITFKEKFSPREVELPHSTGKTRKISIATDEVVTQIEKGIINFDILLATPAQMAKLVKLAKILGPKGLMPNPKTGTIVNDPEALAKSLSSKNTLALKCEKDAPLVHLNLGKLSQADKVITKNISTVLTGLSGLQVKKIVLKSTMSPAIKLQF